MTKPRLIRLRYFLWVIVPVMLWLGYRAYGLPHAIWSYDWIDQGQGMDPFAPRHYTRCTFLGPYGAVTTYPGNGRCGWIVFAREAEAER